jgi:hypothetical protein
MSDEDTGAAAVNLGQPVVRRLLTKKLWWFTVLRFARLKNNAEQGRENNRGSQ